MPDTNAYRTAITFCNAKSISSQTKKSTTPGEATKTLNFFEGAWNSVKNFFTGGNNKVEKTPSQTENSQYFTTDYETEESISFTSYLRSAIEFNLLAYTVNFQPYVSKEGVMRVAESVNLDIYPIHNQPL